MSVRLDLNSVDLTELPLTHEATIPKEYLDSMGHMNVMWYTHLFDQAIDEVFSMIGLTRDFMQTNKTGGFALESHIRYLSEVRVGQTVKIYARMISRSSTRFYMMLFMRNDVKGDLSATFEVIGAYIDLTVRRMQPLPEPVAARIDGMIRQHHSLTWEAPVCGVMKP